MEISHAIRIRGLSKRFGTTQALSEVDLDVREGSVHCLLGENGAGKSTVGKILAGLYAPDAGTIEIDGTSVKIVDIKSAQQHGIGCVFQELSLAADLSVQDNICLGADGRWPLAPPRRREERACCQALLDKLGLDICLSDTVGRLPVAKQQLIEVAKALYRRSKIIVLDEPTAMLGAADVKRLFEVIRSLQAGGTTFIFITHHLDEVRALGDRVTALRDGRIVETFDLHDGLTDAEIIAKVTGPLGEPHQPANLSQPEGPAMLSVRFSDSASIDVRKGEIVGLYGVAGSGREEVIAEVVGLASRRSMRMTLDGRVYRPSSPAQAAAKGVGYLPSGRMQNCVLNGRSIVENLTLTQLPRLQRSGWLRPGAEKTLVKSQLARLQTKYGNEKAAIETLSGGNQQKIFLTRCLQADNRRLVVLEDPSAGVDIAAKHELHQLILRFAAEGGSVILVSSDLSETLALSSRVYTIFAGRIVRELRAVDGYDREGVIADILGGSIH